MDKFVINKESIDAIDIIKDLWIELNSYHKDLMRNFSSEFARKDFDTRKKQLLEKAILGKFNLELVSLAKSNQYIGYCLTTIDKNNIGEIDSIYIKAEYRSLNIGSTLIKNAIEWMNDNKVCSMKISVAYDNHKAIDFYKDLGFTPRSVTLVKI